MKKILFLTFVLAISQICFSQVVIDARSKLLSDKYIIGTDYYTKELTITYISNNKFSYRISSDGCDFKGQFLIINNKGISANKSCGEIILVPCGGMNLFCFSVLTSAMASNRFGPRSIAFNIVLAFAAAP